LTASSTDLTRLGPTFAFTRFSEEFPMTSEKVKLVPTQARLARRRGERGTALIQSVVVATALMSLLALGMFVHRRHVQGLTAAHDARLLAFSFALGGCRGRTDFAGMLQGVFRSGLSSRPDQFVIRTPVPSTRELVNRAPFDSAQLGRDLDLPDLASAALAPCNEVPQPDGGGISALDAYFGQRLFPSSQ
jgi:hypothetical protein